MHDQVKLNVKLLRNVKAIVKILSHFHTMMQNAEASFCTPAGEEGKERGDCAPFRCKKTIPFAYEHFYSDMKALKNHMQGSNASYGNNLPSKYVSKLV